ncbi:hypothetical protein JCM1840_006612 [Sporobolomyces johnsonii]
MSSPPVRPSGHDLDLLEKARFATPVDNIDDVDSSGAKRSLRVAIVTENFLPKVDGVTRTLAMLLEHLQAEGHQAMILGPSSPLKSYAGHEVVSTKGIPLLGVYKGLGLNFVRPRFIRKLREFKPDVIQFIDPIWLCAQTIPLVQYYFPDTPLISSYHTNLAMYATLFGFAWLTPTMWALQRNLHGRCGLTFCPSPSTARMLEEQKFENVRIWPRGVDVDLFRPEARDFTLRQSWGVEPQSLDEDRPSPRLVATDRRSSLDNLPTLSLPPPYSSLQPSSTASGVPHPGSKLVVLYVGRISWEKNLRLLIEAFRGLQEPDPATGRPACQLVFVGDGPSRSEAEALCESYGLGALFMGFRKGQELAAAYASADLFAFPSFTETFGQVVSEAQASGLSVVGLRAEGVCDLVEHERTGLLLDLDDLVSPSSTSSAPQPPAYSPSVGSSSTSRPLPSDPHSLLGSDTPTFPLAVTLYRALLVSATTNHSLRREMGSAAHLAASKRSWFGAMELLVDGYRELVAPPPPEEENLELSRTPTIEFDIVCDDPRATTATTDDEAESTATVSKRRRLVKLGGVLRRTGGRLRESSVTLKPFSAWLAQRRTTRAAVESSSGGGIAFAAAGEEKAPQAVFVRILELAVLFVFVFLSVRWTASWEALSSMRSLAA